MPKYGEVHAVPEAMPFQRGFHARRGHLLDRHVRDMAWLLDSPDLLDSTAPPWQGRIASLTPYLGPAVDHWLQQLDRDPSALHELIAKHAFNRLGRYSELLLAFFLHHLGILHAHGLQVRAGKNETLGEFDFLLWDHDRQSDGAPGLVHWEFATKYYLLEQGDAAARFETLVGPNLADTLGAKMRKIFERQLALSQHPAAQALLPQPVIAAQALIKGWLFYCVQDQDRSPIPGLSADHCKGFWRPLAELDEIEHDSFLILPRLHWLAPARELLDACVDREKLGHSLQEHFAQDSLPVMIALMERDGAYAVEIERGFIVPDDWTRRAGQFVRSD
ncbi:MAG TPA: DUF1853 family protein [Burkholderiaceae bacterium]